MNKDTKALEFQNLIEENKGIIYKIVNLYCKNLEDRKDLTQEVTIQLWRSFPHFDSSRKYSTWMYRIALNVAISFYRNYTLRKNASIPLTESIIAINYQEIDDDKEPFFEQLHAYIAELKELDKAIILLYLEQKSYKEIAEILGLSETNVATKIGRVKIKLKQRFSNSTT